MLRRSLCKYECRTGRNVFARTEMYSGSGKIDIRQSRRTVYQQLQGGQLSKKLISFFKKQAISIPSDMYAGAWTGYSGPCAMLAGLNSRSMPQRTCLIVFQTYHTAEPRRSTYAQLAPYKMRKSPMFTKHIVRLISEHDFFCVVQATLGLLKLTQPGKVDRWSFQTL